MMIKVLANRRRCFDVIRIDFDLIVGLVQVGATNAPRNVRLILERRQRIGFEWTDVDGAVVLVGAGR